MGERQRIEGRFKLSGLWGFVEQKKIVCCKAVRKRKQSSFDRPFTGSEFPHRAIVATDREGILFLELAPCGAFWDKRRRQTASGGKEQRSIPFLMGHQRPRIPSQGNCGDRKRKESSLLSWRLVELSGAQKEVGYMEGRKTSAQKRKTAPAGRLSRRSRSKVFG